jgi:hypothetical protein
MVSPSKAYGMATLSQKSQSSPDQIKRFERGSTARQLSLLFGETLVGPWPELGADFERRDRLRRPRLLLKLGLLLLAFGGLVLLGHSLLAPGLERRTLADRSHYTAELETSLADGDLVHAVDFAALAELEPATATAKTPLSPLTVYAEALFYRYLDADPKRTARIAQELSQPVVSLAKEPRLQLAALVVKSRRERKSALGELEELSRKLPRDSVVYYLLATAQESLGNEEAARLAWVRSADLGPAWLVHRFEQAEFEHHTNNDAEAASVTLEMNRVDPLSPWSKLAWSAFGATLAPMPSRPPSDAAVAPVPVVEVHQELLLSSIQAAKRGDMQAARRALGQAVQVVHGGAPFLLDAFDSLLASGLPALARELAQLPEWPRDHAAARAALQQLSNPPPQPSKPTE